MRSRHPSAPRYDPKQTQSERNGFENLLLLCPKHHKIIDTNPEKFTVEGPVEDEDQEEMDGTREILKKWVVY